MQFSSMAPTSDRRGMGTKPSPKGNAPGATLRARFFSIACSFEPPDLFSSPKMPVCRLPALTSYRQRQGNGKRRKFAKNSGRRSHLRRSPGRPTLSTEREVIDLLGAFLGYSPVNVETSHVQKQSLHLHLLQSMDPRSFMLCIGERSITTHSTATMRVEDAHASDGDGTLEGHRHDV